MRSSITFDLHSIRKDRMYFVVKTTDQRLVDLPYFFHLGPSSCRTWCRTRVCLRDICESQQGAADRALNHGLTRKSSWHSLLPFNTAARRLVMHDNAPQCKYIYIMYIYIYIYIYTRLPKLLNLGIWPPTHNLFSLNFVTYRATCNYTMHSAR